MLPLRFSKFHFWVVYYNSENVSFRNLCGQYVFLDLGAKKLTCPPQIQVFTKFGSGAPCLKLFEVSYNVTFNFSVGH